MHAGQIGRIQLSRHGARAPSQSGAQVLVPVGGNSIKQPLFADKEHVANPDEGHHSAMRTTLVRKC